MKFDMKFTKRGSELRAKAEAGAELQFTRIAFGDGKLTGAPVEITEVAKLQHEVVSKAIRTIQAQGSMAKLSVMFDNQEMEEPFYWREIGVFAMDPDEGELLYAYANSGSEADYIPAKNEMVLERDIHLNIMIGNAEHVTASIDSSAVYVTMREFDEELKKYPLISNTGYELDLSINHQTYVMTLELLNANREVLSEKSIDFPIEGMVVDAEYENGIITLILQNGKPVPVDISHLVGGLVKDTFTIAGIDMKDNITAEEMIKALGIDKIPTYDVFKPPENTSAAGKAGLVPAPAIEDITRVLRGDGTWAAANGHTHVPDDVGALAKDGTAGKSKTIYVPRVNKNPSYDLDVYTAALEEYQSNSEGLPSGHYYHILKSKGGDSNYEVQLAIGMTIVAMYYRTKQAGKYTDWVKIPLLLNENTLQQALKIGEKVQIWSDGEGGNIRITPPDTYKCYWEIDAFNGNLRIYRYDNETKATPTIASFAADGIHGNLKGTADKATALSSSAGSDTQPVYFKDGKPAACTYTLGKSVPSNAVFTDTNTWRGIQDNLSSISTTDSLSAKQGKILKEYIDHILKYKAEDGTFKETHTIWVSGVLSNGNKTIHATIPLPYFRLDDVKVGLYDTTIVAIRQNGSYLKQNVTSESGAFTIQVNDYPSPLTANVNIIFNTSIGGTNNDTISVQLYTTVEYYD